MQAPSCIDQWFIGDEMLERLPLASRVGKTMVGGIDLNKPCCLPHPTASPPAHWLIRLTRSAIKAHPPTVPARQRTI
jgi:hypothetical protein